MSRGTSGVPRLCLILGESVLKPQVTVSEMTSTGMVLRDVPARWSVAPPNKI